MSGGLKPGGATSGLPAGGTSADVLTGDGTWESAGDVVRGVLEAIPAADLAGLVVPTALPGTALHLHRLNEASGTLADQGSRNTAAVVNGSSGVRAAPGPYRTGGGFELLSPSATDRVTVATSVPAGDCSIALTIHANTDAAPAVAGSSITLMALWDGGGNALMLLSHTAGGLYAYCYGASTGSFSSDYTPSSWVSGHRCVVTYEHGTAGATKQVKLYVDGTLRQTFTATAAIAATLTEVTMLGLAGNPFSQGAVGDVTIADAQVWGSKLTAAQVTADWRQVRGLLL